MSITYTLTDGIAEIAIDDGKANAMRTDWFARLNEALDRAEDDEVTAVVLRGRDGVFSGGLDIKWLPTLDRDGLRAMLHDFGTTMLRLYGFPRPTVAAITGHAIAGGCILACACDRRFALDGELRIQMNEVLVHLPVPSWAVAICAGAFPTVALSDLLLFGDVFSPKRAFEIGALHGLAKTPDELLSKAREAAKAAASAHALPFATTKRRLRAPEIERVRKLISEDL
ncbi:MAG: enoyl-CoA hydratase [Deltaproteobacteria bacterium]|nr:enoyl-CoA hydratase [Deltaproteobacteria bacterium]